MVLTLDILIYLTPHFAAVAGQTFENCIGNGLLVVILAVRCYQETTDPYVLRRSRNSLTVVLT